MNMFRALSVVFTSISAVALVKPSHQRASPACSAHWSPDLRSTPLSSVSEQLAPQRHQNVTSFAGGDFSGLFIHPEHKFAFCFIPKVACSSWTDVLWKVLQDDPDSLPEGPERYTVGHLSQKAFGVDGFNQVFSDPTATRAVFVRDPIARFVSGFFNKCFLNDCRSITEHDACPWRAPDEKRQSIPISRAVEAIVKEDASTINAHYRLQSSFCDLDQYIGQYTTIGLMTKDDLASEASCVLKKAGLSKYNTRGPPTYEPYWEAPQDWNASHHALGGVKLESNFTEDEMLQRLFTKTAARKLVKFFKKDYEVFNIPEPVWIEGATGEWYDASPEGCVRVTDSVSEIALVAKTRVEQLESNNKLLISLAGFR